jgi:hypothetical protein
MLAEGRSKHLEPGEAWSFDNQSLHSVVNGDQTRAHLIIDVNPNPKLAALWANAVIDRGEADPIRWAKTRAHLATGPAPLAVAETTPLTVGEKQDAGLLADGFAARVTKVNWKGRVLGAPLRSRDVIVAVDGVQSNVQSRSALDHMRTAHTPGESVTLTIMRAGKRIERRMHLFPDYLLSPRRYLAYVLQSRRRGPPAEASRNY